MERRVVITGLGAITPIGNDVKNFISSLKNGVCGVDFIKSFDTSNHKVKIGAEVKNFNPEDYLERKEAKRMDRFCQFAMVASKEAIEDSKLDLDSIEKDRFGVYIGSGIGGLRTLEKEEDNLQTKGPSRVAPLFIPIIIPNMAAGNIAIKYGAKGPSSCIVTACATGTNCIGEAFRTIKWNDADIMLCGGTEAAITPLGIAGFTSLTALSKSEDPLRASIPFDKERNGFVMGEGSGVLVIEELEHAKKRGAHIYCEIVGYGNTSDAYHMTAPCQDGEGAARAMERALKEAKIKPSDISYINAHGTSTEINDKVETLAIKKVFLDYAKSVPVSSTKSMTGHLLGAAGGVEAIACAKALEEGFIPPTIGYKCQDEECDLDYVPNVYRKCDLKYAMSNSLGFGGHNAVIILKKWDK